MTLNHAIVIALRISIALYVDFPVREYFDITEVPVSSNHVHIRQVANYIEIINLVAWNNRT